MAHFKQRCHRASWLLVFTQAAPDPGKLFISGLPITTKWSIELPIIHQVLQVCKNPSVNDSSTGHMFISVCFSEHELWYVYKGQWLPWVGRSSPESKSIGLLMSVEVFILVRVKKKYNLFSIYLESSQKHKILIKVLYYCWITLSS